MKEFERKEFEKMEKLAAEIERNPMTARFREQEAAEILSKRKEAADKISDLFLDMEATRILQAEIEESILRLAGIDKERQELQKAINEKRYFMLREKTGIEGEIRQAQKILYDCYDPEIDEGIKFFLDKLDFLRSPGRISNIAAGSEKNIITDSVRMKEESNAPAVLAAINYCMASVKELEKMKLAPAFDSQKIENLKKAIPSIDVFTEYVGNRPIADLTPDPRDAYPSDDETDWQMGRLFERAKKLLKR